MKLYSRLVCAVTLGIGLTTGVARAQPERPNEEPLPTDLTRFTNSRGQQELHYPQCNCGHGDTTVKYMSPGDRLRTFCYFGSNCSCRNCYTLWSQLEYIFGSCGNFYCEPVKRDLVSGHPLAEAARSYYPLHPPLSTIPFPDVILPVPPSAGLAITPTAPVPPGPAPVSRDNRIQPLPQLQPVAQAAPTSTLTVFRIPIWRDSRDDSSHEPIPASSTTVTRFIVQPSTRQP